MGGRGGSSSHAGGVGGGIAGGGVAVHEDDGVYKTFSDTPINGWAYDFNNLEASDWFNAHTNVRRLLDRLTESDLDAFGAWTRGDFMGGQQYAGWDKMSKEMKEYTQRFDQVLDRSEIKEGVTVVRLTTAEFLMGAGHKTATMKELQALEGKLVVSKGNMSTAAAAQGLTIGSEDKHHEFRFHIPAGSFGAGMWIGEEKISPLWGPLQHEFMMNRDTTFRVGKTSYDKSRDVYVTDVTFIGRMKHDYGKSGKLRIKA